MTLALPWPGGQGKLFDFTISGVVGSGSAGSVGGCFLIDVLLLLNAVLKATATRVVANGIASPSHRPVSKTAIILRAPSSVFMRTAVAGTSNAFLLGRRPTRCHLLFRRLLCRPRRGRNAKASTNAFALRPGSCTLRRIMMRNRHPLIAIRNDQLACSVPRLASRQLIAGTCRTLGRLPNIVRRGSMLALTKTNEIDLLLGKHPSSVACRRLVALLGNVPTSHIRGTRMVCDTPPRCRIHNTTVGLMLGKCGPNRKNLRKRIGNRCGRRGRTKNGKNIALTCASPGVSLSFVCGLRDGCAHNCVSFVTHRAIGRRVCSIGRIASGRKHDLARALHIKKACGFSGSGSLGLSCAARFDPSGANSDRSGKGVSRSFGRSRTRRRVRGTTLCCASKFKFRTKTSCACFASASARSFFSHDPRRMRAHFVDYSSRCVSH